MRSQSVLDRSWRDEGRVPPPVLFAFAWVAQSVLARKKGGPVSRLAGLALGAGSVGLAAAAAGKFSRERTSLDPLVPDARVLVTTGANSVSRNPMYTGLVGVLVARAVSRRSLKALVPAAVVAFLLDTRQISAEEELLSERFGAEYDAYRSSTPRWIDKRSVDELRELLPEDPGSVIPASVRDKLPDDLSSLVPDKVRDKIPGDLSSLVPEKVRDKLPDGVRSKLDRGDKGANDDGSQDDPSHGAPRPTPPAPVES